MLAERPAWRPVASAASERHCPAMDCSVAMSTFMVPPRPGPLPVAADGRASGRPAAGVVHRAGSCPQMPGELPAGRGAGGTIPLVTARSATDRPASRGARSWTLHGGEGLLDVEVTAAEDDGLGTVL